MVMAQSPYSPPLHSLIHVNVDTTGKSHQNEREKSKMGTTALNDSKMFDMEPVQLMAVTGNHDTSNFNKEQSSYNKAIEEQECTLSDLKLSHELSTAEITEEQFVCTLQSNDQMVPQATPSSGNNSEYSGHLSNQSPFVYNEAIMDWQVIGDDNSAVSSDVSVESTNSEQLMMSGSPVDDTNNNDGHQSSHLVFGQRSVEELTKSLFMLRWGQSHSSSATNSLTGGCTRGSVIFPGNNSVEALAVVEDAEHQTIDHCQTYCPHCRECYRRHINTVLHPCHDACLCGRCAERLMANERPCPLCKQPIRGISPIKLP